MINTTTNPKIAVLGAGHVGPAIARLALNAGHSVAIAASGNPDELALVTELVIPGAEPRWAVDAISSADIVVLTIPLHRFLRMDPNVLSGKLVIDAMNYWWEVDGIRDDLTDPRTSSSEIVQDFLPESRVVKAFNHMGYHDLEDGARPAGSPDRKGIAVAGAPADAAEVAAIVEAFGFDAVIAGPLADGKRLEPGTEPFGANVPAPELTAMLTRYPETPLAREIAESRAAAA